MLKAMRALYAILFFGFTLYAFRALNVLNDVPLAIGCLIMSLICVVAFFYYSELIKTN